MGKSRYEKAREIFTKDEIPSEEYFLITEMVWHFIGDYWPGHEVIKENYPKSLIRKAAKIYEDIRSFYHDAIPCDELLEEDIVLHGFFSEIDKD